MRIRCFYEQQCGSNAHIIRRMLENCRRDKYPCGSFLLIGKVLKKFVNRCPNLEFSFVIIEKGGMRIERRLNVENTKF